MIVHQLDADGYYVGPTHATLSPAELAEENREVWAVPAGCVTVPPPTPKDGYRLRFRDGFWDHEPNSAAVEDVAPEQNASPVSAMAKLAAFLRANPDVGSLIEAEQR